jgi:toxin ParE1/3/4
LKLIISTKAAADLQEIEEYIGADNPAAAANFVAGLTERCKELIRFPGLGRKREEVEPGYRSVTEGDYVIFYLVPAADRIEIVRVIHGKRDLGGALKD